MESPKYTVQQYKKFNGQTVMKALQSMNYNATTNKLAKHIAACNNKREEDIKSTVKRVLSDAVANGFLITRGQSYRLPTPTFIVQTDSRKRLNSRRNAAGKIKKSKSNSGRTARSKPTAAQQSRKSLRATKK
ncbi:hypothetical protein HA402_001068 [Bradysia odoriphaga]|nr:hypothetical protein HA402_001068 [Bradysia odoriphaga]